MTVRYLIVEYAIGVVTQEDVRFLARAAIHGRFAKNERPLSFECRPQAGHCKKCDRTTDCDIA
jgi:hypothetical protein